MTSFEKKSEEVKQAMQITEGRAISKATCGWNVWGVLEAVGRPAWLEQGEGGELGGTCRCNQAVSCSRDTKGLLGQGEGRGLSLSDIKVHWGCEQMSEMI